MRSLGLRLCKQQVEVTLKFFDHFFIARIEHECFGRSPKNSQENDGELALMAPKLGLEGLYPAYTDQVWQRIEQLGTAVYLF